MEFRRINMFNNQEDDYYNAVKHAQVYISQEKKSKNKKLLIFNLFTLALLAYMAFSYIKKGNNTYSMANLKQGVLGVSETVDDLEISDERLMKILKTTEMDTLQNSMKVLINEPTIQSKSSYTEAIARELDDKSGFRGKIAVVNNTDASSQK